MARFIPHFKSDQPDPVFLHRLALIQSVCLIAVGLIAVLSLCARLIPGLRGHTPDGSIMRSGSALAALLSAMSLTLSQPRRSSRMWLASVLCAVMAALIAANTLILTVRFNSSGLNGFFLVNRGESLLPGMSPAIATAFLLLAVVMVLIRERRRYPSNLADLLTFCLCLLVMVLASAFVFGILGIFLFMPNDSVSPLALLCLVLLTFVAAGRRAENGIFTILLGAGLGSKIARLFFPVIVLLPFVREIARARAIQAGLLRSGYASAVATSLAAVFAFSLLLIMAWRMNTLEREVRELSLRDELCGIYNRRGFFLLAEQSLRMAQRAQLPFSIVFVDVDNLKQVNDLLGHNTGSALLAEMGQLLKTAFRDTDITGRIGGDEFAVAGLFSEAAISVATARLEEAAGTRNSEPGRRFKLRFSVGHVTSEASHRESLEELLVMADRAMYQAKHRNKRSAL
jgi:diguanylate cyclase (GGDEF)-like protein